MKTSKLILIYAAILMILSQSLWSRYVIFFAIPLLITLVFRHTKISSFGFTRIWFLNLIVLMGFISGVVHLSESNIYFFARDIMYFVQAPVFIIIGMYLFMDVKDLKKLLKIIILTSSVITIYTFSDLIMDPSIIFRLGLGTRYEYGLSSPTAILAFVILFYARKIKYNIFTNWVELFVMIISLFSIVISFSRTSYVLLLIILIIPYISKSRVIIKMYGASILLVLFVIFGGLFLEQEAAGLQGSTFASKVANSLSEMTVQNYQTAKEINNNWRGYEAYLGLSKYYEGDLAELLFGQGYGAIVYTPTWIFGVEKLAVLPMFHNGYITIILKTGLIGLFLFFIFLLGLLKTATKTVKTTLLYEKRLSGILLQASVFIVFFQTFVIHGIFRTTAPVVLLVLIGIILQVLSIKQNIDHKDEVQKNA